MVGHFNKSTMHGQTPAPGESGGGKSEFGQIQEDTVQAWS